MRSRKRILILATSLGLCAIVLWIWTGAGSAPAPDRPLTNETETTGPALIVGAAEPNRDPDPQQARTELQAKADVTESASPGEPELLEGIVVTADGEPLAGAGVELQRRDAQGFTSYELEDVEHSKTMAQTQTNEDGTFSFTVPSLHQFALEVTAEGYGPELVFACYGGQYREVVLEESCVLEGTVSSAGDQSPMEGVDVWIIKLNAIPGMTDNTGFATLARVMTDVRGYYRVEDLPHTELSIMVMPPLGLLTGMPSTVLEPGRVVRKDFLVEPGTTFTGTVRDAVTGQPIAGARVEDYPWSMYGVRTDERGQFEMTGSESMIPLKVRAKGYGGAAVIAGSAEQGPQTVDIELMPGGAVEGRILDPDGAPLREAYVAGVARGQERDLRREWVSTRTAADGRFRIEDLSSDMDHYLVARHPGYGAVAYAFSTPVQAAATVDFGDVVLRAVSAVRGRVVDQAGNGLPAVFVELQGTNKDALRYRPDKLEEMARAPLGAIDQSTITDDQGVFRFGSLAPGNYTVGAKKEALNTRKAEVTIGDWGQVIEGVEILLDVSLAVSGRVRTPTGELPGGFIVSLESVDEGGFRTLKQYYDSDGVFEVSSVPEGTYNIIASLLETSDTWGSGVVSRVAAGTTGVEVTLRRVAWIEGTVLDANGDPAQGITVYGTWNSSGVAGRRSAKTGTDGSFRLRVGEGDLVEMHVGPPVAPGAVGMPDPQREVIVPGVVAGTRGLIIRLR